jgi:hypothetical protein
MSKAFAEMKANREDQLKILIDKADQMNQKKSTTVMKDERYWSPTTNKSGNSSAIIRFLPPLKGECAWERMFRHYFQGTTGSWYIANSLSTIGKTDPVLEQNTLLWNRGDDKAKDQVRKQKRKLRFISNILVIKDPAHPENEGKVFLYSYPKVIFEMLERKMKPEETELGTAEPMNPFDMYNGCNLRLITYTKAGWPKYDKCEFESPSPVADGDEDEMELIYNSQYSLSAEVAPDKFEDYDVLKKRLDKVNGANVVSETNDDDLLLDDENDITLQYGEEKDDIDEILNS